MKLTSAVALTFWPLLCFSFKKVDDQKAVIVSTSNFDEYVTTEKFALVLFFAPWQKSCDKSQEAIDKIAEFFHEDKSIVVAKANIYIDGKLASRFDIEDYCKIKYFVRGSKVAERFVNFQILLFFMKYNVCLTN